MSEAPAPVLTDDEIAVLNEARSILTAVGTRIRPNEYGEGYSACRVEMAEHAIFQALNSLNSRRLVPLTQEQLHNRTVEAVA